MYEMLQEKKQHLSCQLDLSMMGIMMNVWTVMAMYSLMYLSLLNAYCVA